MNKKMIGQLVLALAALVQFAQPSFAGGFGLSFGNGGGYSTQCYQQTYYPGCWNNSCNVNPYYAYSNTSPYYYPGYNNGAVVNVGVPGLPIVRIGAPVHCQVRTYGW